LKNIFIFFLLNPFLGFINAFRYFKQDWARNSVWLFVIFYGFSMSKPEIVDTSRYVMKLKVLHESESSWEGFVKTLYELDERGSGNLDLYQPIVTYIVSLFTSNGDLLFAVFGMVFGFFYSRNCWFLLQTVQKQSLSWPLLVLLITFLCVIGFWSLGGVRMWTAAHVFFYGTFLYLMKHRNVGIVIAALSLVIHFSFILPSAFLAFYILIKPSHKILFYVFISSFFISALDLTFVNTAIEAYAPEFIVPRVQNYVTDEYAEVITEMNTTGNWYILLYGKAINWSIAILLSVIYFKSNREFIVSRSWYKLFGFSMVLMIIGNLLASVPSGGRYATIAQLFAVATIFLAVCNNTDLKFQRNINFVTPILLFFIIVSIRVAFDTITVDTIFSNPVFASFLKIGTPLIDLIK
jgi:hypothetical protein